MEKKRKKAAKLERIGLRIWMLGLTLIIAFAGATILAGLYQLSEILGIVTLAFLIAGIGTIASFGFALYQIPYKRYLAVEQVYRRANYPPEKR